MTKTIKISAAAHEDAKQRAKATGMKLQAFVERAIDLYRPTIVQGNPPSESRGRKRAAG